MTEDMRSRVENILNSMLGTVDPADLLPAQSRVEAILMSLDNKIDELGDLAGKLPIHICTSGEYNQLTGIPTIDNPEVDIFYLVPDGTGNDLYTEWIYTGDKWEYFGEKSQRAIDAADEARESATSAAASAAAAQAVKDSIPEDYTELSADVSDLKSQIKDSDNAILDLMGTSVFEQTASAKITGNYIKAFLFEDINLKSGVTYTLSLKLSSAQSVPVYLTISDSTLSDLKGLTIAAGNTTVATTYTPAQDYTGVKIFISAATAAIGVIGTCTLSSDEVNNVEILKTNVSGLLNTTLMEPIDTFSITSATAVNRVTTFGAPLKAGKYYLKMDGFTGKLWASLRDSTGTVIGTIQQWYNGKIQPLEINSDAYSVAYYAAAAWITTSASVTLTIIPFGLIGNSVKTVQTGMGVSPNLLMTTSGAGTPSSPFISTDGTGGLADCIAALKNRGSGGKLLIPNGCYTLTTPLTINGINCLHIEGESWNYPAHPNGVHESNDGTKLKIGANSIPAIIYAGGNGGTFSNFGIVGRISNSDTSGAYDRDNRSYNVGFYHTVSYSDQIELRRVNFTGLAAAIVAGAGSNIDAATFTNLNMDGCDVGIVIDGAQSIYTKIIDNLIADTPGYGLFIGPAATCTGLIIQNNIFVRNSGKFSVSQKSAFTEGIYAVYLNDLRSATITGNTIHTAGTYYNTVDASNKYYEYEETACGLYLDGETCTLSNNSIIGAQANSAVISGVGHNITGNQLFGNHEVVLNCNNSLFAGNRCGSYATHTLIVNGDGNVITGNYIAKSIYVTGDNNVITRTGGETVTVAGGATGNVLIGFDSSDITDNGTSTVIK